MMLNVYIFFFQQLVLLHGNVISKGPDIITGDNLKYIIPYFVHIGHNTMTDSSEVNYRGERPGRVVASATGSSGGYGGTQLGLLRVRSMSNVEPDTEENVEAQTETVFRNYVYQSYRHDSMRQELDLTPAIPELVNFPTDPIR